jgi:hypothetical protein
MTDPEDTIDPENLRGEAEAQREATVMPWIWGVFGLVAIAVFVVWVVFGAGQAPMRQPSAAAPAAKAAGGY